jgi:hypothetical protein
MRTVASCQKKLALTIDNLKLISHAVRLHLRAEFSRSRRTAR